MTSIKLNKKSRNKRKSCKKTKHRKKYTTRKHKRCAKFCKGGMVNEDNNNGEECPMCLTPINTQDNLIMFRNLFECTHDFHKECIIGLVKATKETSNDIFRIVCPLCRAVQNDHGNYIIETIDRILDMNDRRTRRNMFRDLLQYDYPYDANEDTFFRLYVLPISTRMYDNGRYFMYWHYNTLQQTARGANFYYLSFVITGNNARRTLIRDYNSFRHSTYMYIFLNLLQAIGTTNRNQQNILLTNAFIMFFVLNLDNISTDLPTEINTMSGRISIVDIITELINMFGRFVVDNTDFENYNPHLPDRQLGGVSNATSNNNKRNISFKITSMEDMKEFLDIVDKNKTKLESLLDKQPFTLYALFPEVEYTPELVQKLTPLIKN